MTRKMEIYPDNQELFRSTIQCSNNQGVFIKDEFIYNLLMDVNGHLGPEPQGCK